MDTHLTPTAGVGDLGTTVTQMDTVFEITGGTRPDDGPNLFHSFAEFSLGSDTIADFVNDSGLATENIVGRVTGGVRSEIDGTIRTTGFPGASLFLLNPTGLSFGPNAVLDVEGSLHASTADYLRLGANQRFFADPLEVSSLSTAPPSAFGFLQQAPNGLSVEGAQLTTPEDATLSLAGGDIEITNEALVQAPSGLVNLASVASPGEVVFGARGESPDLSVDSFERLGEISVTAASEVRVTGDGGGTLLIRAGRFVVDGGSALSASASGPADGSLVAETGAGMDIEVTGKVLVDNGSFLQANVENGVAHDGGGVRIEAGEFELGNETRIDSVAFAAFTAEDGTFLPASTGQGGSVDIAASHIVIRDGGFVRVNTGGAGNGGDIVLDAQTLEVLNGSTVFTLAIAGSGDAGDIKVSADTVIVANRDVPGSAFTGFTTQSSSGDPAPGDAGSIEVAAARLDVVNGGVVSSITFNDGAGGDITIRPKDQALEVTVSGTPEAFRGIFANSFGGAGAGGAVDISAQGLRVDNLGSIQAGSFGGQGPGGTIRLRVKSLEIADRGFLSSKGTGTGDAGSIAIAAERVAITDGGGIFSNTFDFSTGEYGPANAGDIEIATGELLIAGFESAENPFAADGTIVESSAQDGRSGNIRIRASEAATLTNRGQINSGSFGTGAGGTIDVVTPSLTLSKGAIIIASAFGAGPGGDVHISADEILVSGVHPEPFSTSAGAPQLAPSAIGSQGGLQGGDAGDISIRADTLSVLDGAYITADTFGPGDGGDINIVADRTIVSGLDATAKAFYFDQLGDPERATRLASASLLTSSQRLAQGEEANGNAGSIRISSGTLEIADNGTLASRTETAGAGGRIELRADQIFVSGGATINSESAGRAPAGSIEIRAAGSVDILGGSVTTEALEADGGDIHITATELVRIEASEVTTSILGAGGSGGNIDIDPKFVVTMGGTRILANATNPQAVRAGNITITGENLLISADTRIEATGPTNEQDGEIILRGPDADLTGNVLPLSAQFLDAPPLSTGRCAMAQSGAQASSLVVAGAGGVPLEPDGYLPTLVVGLPAVADLPIAPGRGPTGYAVAEIPLGCRI